MKEKLQELMTAEKIKPSQLAEKLEINPAVISHIAAGRNKPSFELLQKILRKFPRVNPDWLLLDSGPIYREERSTGSPASTISNPVKNGETNNPGNTQCGNLSSGTGSDADLFNFAKEQHGAQSETVKNDQTVGLMSAPLNAMIGAGKKAAVQRIVIFYEDQTFETFTPKSR